MCIWATKETKGGTYVYMGKKGDKMRNIRVHEQQRRQKEEHTCIWATKETKGGTYVYMGKKGDKRRNICVHEQQRRQNEEYTCT